MIMGTGVIVRNQNGDILIGKRTDGKGWCGGGGHIEEGETPYMAARRELIEEFGIFPIGMKPLGEIQGTDYISWIFLAENFFGRPKADPREIEISTWVNPSDLIYYDLFEPFQKSLSLLPAKLNGYSWRYSLDPKSQPEGITQYDDSKTITMQVNDPDNNIESMLEYIGGMAKSGHSFQVLVDPQNKGEQSFYVDGDGPDHIEKMEVETDGSKDSDIKTIDTGPGIHEAEVTRSEDEFTIG